MTAVKVGYCFFLVMKMLLSLLAAEVPGAQAGFLSCVVAGSLWAGEPGLAWLLGNC